MSTAVDSANLILKLYESRREEQLRKAREFFNGFDPKSIEDVQQTLMGPNSAFLRMVISYWDMACSFVVHGAINQEMFESANGEHIAVYAKMEPFIPQLRQLFGNPEFLKNLEHVVTGTPVGRERVVAVRERMKMIAAIRAQAAAKA